MCHLVRAARHRPGDVVAGVLTSVSEVIDRSGDTSSRLAILL
jgi:hypothetical protein